MFRAITAASGLGLMLALSACGDTCESLKAEMEEIGQEIQKDPSSAFERAKELQELTNKALEMNCVN